MKNNKYKASINKRYYSNKSENINPQFFRNKIFEAQKLYEPQYNDLSKSKINPYKMNEDNYNIDSAKKYLKFKQILDNYMNDYEKMKKQNKIPNYDESNNYSYQEFESKKNNVKEIFDSLMDLNGNDEFNDTDKIIQNLPDDYDNMFLKNDFTKKDYALRYQIIKGEKLTETNEKENVNIENDINQDNNELNQNCYLENNEEDEENDDNNYYCTEDSSCPNEYYKLKVDTRECIKNDINTIIADLIINETEKMPREEEIEYYDNLIKAIEQTFTSENFDIFILFYFFTFIIALILD